jgi:hypothetical protein
MDIVEYNDVVGVSCPCNRGIKNIIRDVVEYIEVEGFHAPVIEGLKILLEIL